MMETKDRLLEAAAAITARDGFAALTLEAVAAQAQVSKGGLLYHFASKEALVHALMARLVTQFDAAHADEWASEAAVIGRSSPGRWTRAYVRASLQDETEDQPNVAAGLLAAVALDPGLLEPLRQRYAEWQRALRTDGLPGVDAQVVRFAVDGIWLCSLLGLGAPDPAMLRRLSKRLLELAGASK